MGQTLKPIYSSEEQSYQSSSSNCINFLPPPLSTSSPALARGCHVQPQYSYELMHACMTFFSTDIDTLPSHVFARGFAPTETLFNGRAIQVDAPTPIACPLIFILAPCRLRWCPGLIAYDIACPDAIEVSEQICLPIQASLFINRASKVSTGNMRVSLRCKYRRIKDAVSFV